MLFLNNTHTALLIKGEKMTDFNLTTICVIIGFMITAAWMFAHNNANKKVEQRLEKLERLESWTLKDVANRLKDSFIILGNDRQILKDTKIYLPDEKKYGVLNLGKESMIIGCEVQSFDKTAKEEVSQ